MSNRNQWPCSYCGQLGTKKEPIRLYNFKWQVVITDERGLKTLNTQHQSTTYIHKKCVPLLRRDIRPSHSLIKRMKRKVFHRSEQSKRGKK